MVSRLNICMLFAGWEVRTVKNCDRGVENAARGRRPMAAFSRPRSQFFTIRTYLSLPLSNLPYLPYLSQTTLFTHGKKTHASLTVTVVRDKKIRTVLRTNQITEFVTVTTWEKKCYLFHLGKYLTVTLARVQLINPLDLPSKLEMSGI